MTGGLINVYDNGVEFGHLPRRLHADRESGKKLLQDGVSIDADHAAVRSGHSAIGLIGRAAREHARIRRGNVSVRADHRGHASIEIPTHRNLLAGDLGVKVQEADLDGSIKFAQNTIRGAKRAIDRGHVSAALKVQYGAFYAIPGADCNDSFARPLGVIPRSQEARLPVEVIENVAFVPNVIPGGEDVNAEFEEVFGDRGRDAESAGRVFAVRDDEIDRFRLYNVFQMIGYNAAPRRSEYISDEENVHLFEFNVARVRRASAEPDKSDPRGEGGRYFCAEFRRRKRLLHESRNPIAEALLGLTLIEAAHG